MRAFVTLRWLGLHALLVASLVVLGRIGYWQWDKAQTQGDWQNYGYALQWWLFGAFAVFLWIKLVLDELDPSRLEGRSDEPRLVEPDRRPRAQDQVEAGDDEDELAAYNRHLRWLAENAER